MAFLAVSKSLALTFGCHVQSQVKALVEDGVRYTSARIAEARGGSSTDAGAHRSSYTSLSEAKDAADSAEENTAAPA
eukprot:COSAG02_NODE_41058_length_398_cov_1.374582_1_plen_76_part_10